MDNEIDIVDPVCNGFILRYSDGVTNPRITLLKRNGNSLLECGYVDDVTPESDFQVHWCTSTADKVLLRAFNTSWVEFSITDEPSVTLWKTGGKEFEDEFECRYAMCGKCGLVVSAAAHDSILEFNFFEFSKEPQLVIASQVFRAIRDILSMKSLKFVCVRLMAAICVTVTLHIAITGCWFSLWKIHLFCNFQLKQCSSSSSLFMLLA